MAIGVVILAHEHLRRTLQLARAVSGPKCKVVIHVDANAPKDEYDALVAGLARNRNVRLSPRMACRWGGFSLVEAGLVAAQDLLDAWPEVTHVVQISGACLPTRPVNDIIDFLSSRPGEDFVECTTLEEGDWVKDGLREERFTLFFPFSWKRQRWLFDRCVDLQRKLRVKRAIPEGLTPSFGSQWWCLCRETLTAILNDPLRAKYNRFFRWCWIPDESYVPSLVHRHSRRLNRHSLTMSRFDAQGKPYIFYDDHALILEQTDYFFVRKIWHGADGLYRRFLQKKPEPLNRSVATDLGLETLFHDAEALRSRGRKGRLHAGRFPCEGFAAKPQTCRNYSVFIGFQNVFQGFDTWLEATTGALAHGRVFQKSKVAFALGLKTVAAGAIPANTGVRNINPEQFLANMLWNQRDRHQTMFFEMSDGRRMAQFITEDPNAEIYALRGAWILDLLHRRPSCNETFLKQAARLKAIEEEELARMVRLRDDVTILSLSDMVQGTPRLLRYIQDRVRPGIDLRPAVTVMLRDLSGLHEFVERLERDGLDTGALGKLPDCLPGDAAWGNPERILASA